MKDLTKYFIDLSKCSEAEQKHIFSILPEPEKPDYYEVYKNYKYLQFIPASKFGNDRWMVDKQAFNKTELSYTDFIKMFEGGEDNNGWIKIESEADLPPYNKWVIAHTKDGGNHIAYFDKRRSEWVANSKFGDEITHWRHQPEPPKF